MTQSLTRIFVLSSRFSRRSALRPRSGLRRRAPLIRRRRNNRPRDSKRLKTSTAALQNIISEGVRLHAELFSLKSLAGKPLPTIIQAHGWGGVAASFRWDALALANAGYLVIDFDYRGWGQSDGRIVLKAPPEKKGRPPLHRAGGRVARVRRPTRTDDRLVQRHQLGDGRADG